jgi:hypothetical protein
MRFWSANFNQQGATQEGELRNEKSAADHPSIDPTWRMHSPAVGNTWDAMTQSMSASATRASALTRST